MTIDQKLEYLRKAMEMGADIDVKFYQFNDKDSALDVVKALSEFSKIPYEQQSFDGANWFKCSDGRSLNTIVFFKNPIKEVSA